MWTNINHSSVSFRTKSMTLSQSRGWPHNLHCPRFTAGANPPPKPVIAKFFYYIMKEKILQSSRQQCSTTVQSPEILIFQDSQQLLQKLFTPIWKYLLDHNIKFQLQYPAKLRISENGQVTTYMDLEEANILQDVPFKVNTPSSWNVSPATRTLFLLSVNFVI